MAAALPIGQLVPFDPKTGDWLRWQSRYEDYCVLNGVTEGDRQRRLLTLSLGDEVHKILTDLVSPDSIRDKSPAELLQLLSAQFQPKKLVVAESVRFWERNQREEESIAQYVAELRYMAKSCDFGQFLNRALRDKLVSGLRSQTIQRRLLGEEDVQLARAIELATSMEAADRDSTQLNRQKNGGNGDLHQFQRQRPPQVKSAVSTKCFRCNGTTHSPDDCWFKEAECRKCHKVGHVEKACRQGQKNSARHTVTKPPAKKFNKSGKSHQIFQEEFDADMGHLEINCNDLPRKFLLNVDVNGKSLQMEVDTGAAVTVINDSTWKWLGQPKLHKCKWKLTRYGNDPLKIVGQCDVEVTLAPRSPLKLQMIVVRGNGSTLMGRSWIAALKLDVNGFICGSSQVNSITPAKQSDQLDSVLTEFNDIFREGLGHCKKILAKLVLKEGAIPKFFKPRPIPFALREKVEADLNRLEKLGVLTPVQTAEWAAPIVPVSKPNGTVRVCGDYKVTVNPYLDVDQYPLPRPEELFAALNGGQKFTKLDLSEAYLQLELDPESKKLLTINTHKGLYMCNRLMYGVASAPAIFQKKMDEVLPRKDGIVVYMDDVLITGKTDAEHMENVRLVFSRLREFGLRIRQAKCRFFQESVEYLGRIIDRNGVHVSPKKVSAVLDIPAPTNQSQLRSFMGCVNHYGGFIQNLADLSAPLNRLLKKDIDWKWTGEHQKSFEALKNCLTSATVLAHFDPKVQLGLVTDASPIGLGAVLFHRYPDGTERPISYASKTLTSAETHYSQIEREGLGLIFGVKKFHQYLYGTKFTMVTDHQPLEKIFGPKTGIPVVASSRLQRWAIILAGYNYEIEGRRSNRMGNADCLSRLPVGYDQEFDNRESHSQPANVFHMNAVDTVTAMTSKSIAKETAADSTLQKVLKFVQQGFPRNGLSAEEKLYSQQLLSSQDGVLLFGLRVVIPTTMRPAVLKELHGGHPGIIRMKSLARQYVWWPSMNKDIEAVVHKCDSCQLERNDPPAAPIHLWEEPNNVWDRVHVDYAGPFHNRMWLILVDAKSGWPEVIEMTSVTSAKTIEALREIFGRFGLPRQIVSDNGRQFTSEEFEDFCKRNGVRHSLSSPYHPRSNGAAERFVQTFKNGVKTGLNDPDGNLKKIVQRFLLHYRVTPHSTKVKSPAEMMFNRQPNTRLSLLRPTEKLTKEGGDVEMSLKGTRKLEPNQTVWARNYASNRKWLKGVIIDVVGPLTYRVKVGEKLWKRHIDQLRRRVGNSSEETDENIDEDDHNWDGFKSDPPAQPVQPAQPNQQPQRPRNRRIPVAIRTYPLRDRLAQQQQQQNE